MDETTKLKAIGKRKDEVLKLGRQKFLCNGQLVFEWEQTLDEVHVFIQPPKDITAAMLQVNIQPKKLSVGLKRLKQDGTSPYYLDEETYSLVSRDSSFWMMEDGELHVQLGKVKKGEVWPRALNCQTQLDPIKQQAAQEQLMRERFQEENPGFDFAGASFSGQAPDPRTFMGGVRYD
eukprot:GHVS01086385.1.p1 GENE.GHVS01086385.1~~GHVS01086385.1.p1  ORF type:complete len:177 (-),score=34.43 GHVS01086385.1:265-795(-)